MAFHKLALDEDVAHSLASLLRSHGLDADSARELGRLGLSDADVLLRAARSHQILVTHNRQDFRLLHETWQLLNSHWSREIEAVYGQALNLTSHAGILIVPQLPVHELARVIEQRVDESQLLQGRLCLWSRKAGWVDW